MRLVRWLWYLPITHPMSFTLFILALIVLSGALSIWRGWADSAFFLGLAAGMNLSLLISMYVSKRKQRQV